MRILLEKEEALMAIQRRVALIGTGMGPWISTQGLREPTAKVTGMREGGRLRIIICDYEVPQMFHGETPDEANEVSVSENGIFSLREARWMRVVCHDGGRNVICDILTKKAVA
jgi:hypothetical protein